MLLNLIHLEKKVVNFEDLELVIAGFSRPQQRIYGDT